MSIENPLLTVPESAMSASSPEVRGTLRDLVQRGELGLFVTAPHRVCLAERRRLPLVGCLVQTLRDDARNRPFQESAIVVACSLRSGAAYAGRAFASAAYMLDVGEPIGDPGEGVSGDAFELDVADRLGLPRGPTTYAAWVLVRDRISNVVHVEIDDPPPAYDDPEVAKFVSDWQAAHVPPAPHVSPPRVRGQKVPAYGTVAGAPKVPSRKGIALALPERVAMGPSATCELLLSFRLPALPRHIVRHAAGEAGQEGATAVVPVTVVVTGDDFAGPFAAELRVPSFTPVDPADPAPVVEGQAVIDLLALPGMWRSRRTMFVWAFSGEQASEPCAVAFA